VPFTARASVSVFCRTTRFLFCPAFPCLQLHAGRDCRRPADVPSSQTAFCHDYLYSPVRAAFSSVAFMNAAISLVSAVSFLVCGAGERKTLWTLPFFAMPVVTLLRYYSPLMPYFVPPLRWIWFVADVYRLAAAICWLTAAVADTCPITCAYIWVGIFPWANSSDATILLRCYTFVCTCLALGLYAGACRAVCYPAGWAHGCPCLLRARTYYTTFCGH